MPKAPYGRGICSVCRYEFNLRKDGAVRVHGDDSFPPGNCVGAGVLPHRVTEKPVAESSGDGGETDG